MFFYLRLFFYHVSAQVFWKRVHNSIEIVNIKGLFLWTVGYVDMATYPLTKYYYIIERAYLIFRLLILFASTLSFLLFLHTAL